MKNKFGSIAVFVAMLAIAFAIASIKLRYSKSDYLVFTFLNVGQGDSILIETPTGERILVDGGPGDAVLTELSLVSSYIKPSLDYVFVTHSDSDHLAGIFYVGEKYDEVQYRLNLPETKKSALENEWKYGGEGFISGDSLVFGEVLFEALWPSEDALVYEKDRNDKSIILKVSYKEFCAVLTGDASSKVEDSLIDEYGQELDCQLLKVSHHGSATATSQKFLEGVSPAVAVISVGEENKFGHPDEGVLERLKQAQVIVFRTDKHGRVKIWTDGVTLRW